MNVRELLQTQLRLMGADGLCIDGLDDDGCGCGLDDFMPCNDMSVDCEAAKVKRIDGQDRYFPIEDDT